MPVPRLFDPTGVFRSLGLLAAGPPVPFVASVRFLAGAPPDSTLAVVGISMANDALSFRRNGRVGFEAKYGVEVTLARGERIVRHVSSEEVVRVAGFQETQRGDESVIFQQFIAAAPGAYDIRIGVHDEYGVAQGVVHAGITVPRLTNGLSSLIPIYRAAPRSALDRVPRILVNPRATAPYGLDSLRFYLEAYATPPHAAVAVSVLGAGNRPLWSDRVPLAGSGSVAWVRVAVPPDRLEVGALPVVATLDGDSSRMTVLVSFSDRWVITSFDEVLSLLRYFGADRALGQMRAASADDRPRLWRAFWKATDPDPATPENEALEEYFERVQSANARFREAGAPGWLTDRGEVFITLGEPDDVFDATADPESARRVIRWSYLSYRLTLDFIDDGGFGRYRLSPGARADYERVLRQVRHTR